VTILFSAGASEIFATLPEAVKRRAAHSIELLADNPRMYPVRRRGLMQGYRYFVAYGVLFYYSASSTEIRISAILPGRMRQA
jgi:plasmid stabilization system protein ParE